MGGWREEEGGGGGGGVTRQTLHGFLQEAELYLSDEMQPYKDRDGGSGDFSSESCDFQLL